MTISPAWERMNKEELNGLSYIYTTVLSPPRSTEAVLEESLEEMREQQAINPLDNEQLAERIATIFADTLCPIPFSKYHRNYPIIDNRDTRGSSDLGRYFKFLTQNEYRLLKDYFWKSSSLATRLTSEHALALSFQDDEIVKVLPFRIEMPPETPFIKGWVNKNRFIILQRGMRGCVEACACMILSNHLKTQISPESTSLGDDEDIERKIRSYSRTPLISWVNNLKELDDRLNESGPACIPIHSVGSHEVVVDEVAENGVHIRDPYHGWAVVVTHESFNRRIRYPLQLIQIEKIKSCTFDEIENRFRESLQSLSDAEVQKKLEVQLQRAMNQMNRQNQDSVQKRLACSSNLDSVNGEAIAWRKMTHNTPYDFDIGICKFQGRADFMRDTCLSTLLNWRCGEEEHAIPLFGLFNGFRGFQAPPVAAEHLQYYLVKALTEYNPRQLTDVGIWSALKMAFIELNKHLRSSLRDKSVTTATIVLILDRSLWVLNVGRNLVILQNGKEPVQLTEEADPDDPRYLSGIIKRDGFVFEHLTNGVFPFARGLGDISTKRRLNERPKITRFPIAELSPDHHLIMASGEISKKIPSKKIAAVAAAKGDSVDKLAKIFVRAAYRMGAPTNLSAIVLKIT